MKPCSVLQSIFRSKYPQRLTLNFTSLTSFKSCLFQPVENQLFVLRSTQDSLLLYTTVL